MFFSHFVSIYRKPFFHCKCGRVWARPSITVVLASGKRRLWQNCSNVKPAFLLCLLLMTDAKKYYWYGKKIDFHEVILFRGNVDVNMYISHLNLSKISTSKYFYISITLFFQHSNGAYMHHTFCSSGTYATRKKKHCQGDFNVAEKLHCRTARVIKYWS